MNVGALSTPTATQIPQKQMASYDQRKIIHRLTYFLHDKNMLFSKLRLIQYFIFEKVHHNLS